MNSNFYDALNEIFWSEDLLKNFIKSMGSDYPYYFDEIDKCIYYKENI